MIETKICIDCKLTLSLDEFNKGKDKFKKNSYCRKCSKKRFRKYYVTKKVFFATDEEHRKKKYQIRKKHNLMKRYGLTIKEFEAMLIQQQHKCGICFCKIGGNQISVDHDHKNGRVRSLLCPACNFGLGFLSDGIQNLQRTLRYLKKKKYLPLKRAMLKEPMNRRDYKIRYRYHITLEDVNRLLKKQLFLCPICSQALEGKKEIDHDHSSSVLEESIRGILHPNCNSGIGAFKDSEIILKSAIKYLEKHR